MGTMDRVTHCVLLFFVIFVVFVAEAFRPVLFGGGRDSAVDVCTTCQSRLRNSSSNRRISGWLPFTASDRSNIAAASPLRPSCSWA